MRIFPKNIFIQNIDSFLLRENFLISSLGTILIIRFFLKLTNYPQIGSSTFHIAHLLWGGFFMLVSFLLIFSFLSRGAMSLSSVVAGVGFGAFIDELGKFITRDNNYFFQPTIAIIYIIFISLYITSRFLSQRKNISKQEYLINAIDMIKEFALNDLDSFEKKKAMEYLLKSDQEDPLVKILKSFLGNAQTIKVSDRSLWSEGRHYVSEKYYQFTRSKVVRKLLIFMLILQLVVSLSLVSREFTNLQEMSIINYGIILSTITSGIFVILGVILFTANKHTSYLFFKVSILISIFITQPFLFYQEQLSAIVGLLVNLLLLAVVDYALNREEISINPQLES